jgi:hypothetical protein
MARLIEVLRNDKLVKVKVCKYCMNRIAKRKTVCKLHTYSKRKSIEKKKKKKIELRPFNRLYRLIKGSAYVAGTGGQAYKFLKEAGQTPEEIKEMYKSKSHYVSPAITPKSLKHKLEKIQDGLCYWTGRLINPNWIFTQKGEEFENSECLAMGADRVNCGSLRKHGYTLKNIVMTTRGVNRMRGNMEHDDFVRSLRKLRFPINPKLRHIT